MGARSPPPRPALVAFVSLGQLVGGPERWGPPGSGQHEARSDHCRRGGLAITLIVVSLGQHKPITRPYTRNVNSTGLRTRSTSCKIRWRMRIDVRDLLIDVFGCTFVNTTTPTTFPDGTVGFPLFYDQFCLGAAAAGRPAR